jgi:hypothetical protein
MAILNRPTHNQPLVQQNVDGWIRANVLILRGVKHVSHINITIQKEKTFN